MIGRSFESEEQTEPRCGCRMNVGRTGLWNLNVNVEDRVSQLGSCDC